MPDSIPPIDLVDIKIPFYAIVRVPKAAATPVFYETLMLNGDRAAHGSDALIHVLQEVGLPARYVGIEDTAYWETRNVEAEELPDVPAATTGPAWQGPVSSAVSVAAYDEVASDCPGLPFWSDLVDDGHELPRRFLVVWRDSFGVEGYVAKSFDRLDEAQGYLNNPAAFNAELRAEAKNANWMLHEIHDLVRGVEVDFAPGPVILL